MIRITRRSNATSEMSFSTISDIAFLLIIFFMVTSSFIAAEGFHLILPDSSKRPVITSRDRVLILTVKKTGEVFSDNRKMKNEEISGYLERVFLKNRKKSVLLQTEEMAPYGRVVEIIEMVKSTGFTALSLKMMQ